MREEKVRLQTEATKLAIRKKELSEKIELIRGNPFVIKHKAVEYFKMLAPGETLILFKSGLKQDGGKSGPTGTANN